jgi:hypothetical protein
MCFRDLFLDGNNEAKSFSKARCIRTYAIICLLLFAPIIGFTMNSNSEIASEELNWNTNIGMGYCLSSSSSSTLLEIWRSSRYSSGKTNVASNMEIETAKLKQSSWDMCSTIPIVLSTISLLVSGLVAYVNHFQKATPVFAISALMLKKPEKSKHISLLVRLQVYNKGAKCLIVNNAEAEISFSNTKYYLKPSRTLDWTLLTDERNAVKLPFSPFPILISAHSAYLSSEHIVFESSNIYDGSNIEEDIVVTVSIRYSGSKQESSNFKIPHSPIQKAGNGDMAYLGAITTESLLKSTKKMNG